MLLGMKMYELKIGKIAGLFLFILLIGCGGGKKERSKPVVTEGKREFDQANLKITGKSDGIYYGNTKEAAELAKNYSTLIKKMQPLFFEGGKKKRLFSLTGEKFLTYCQMQPDKVLFLVHVPQFKRYKGEVRDTLLELAWMVAEKTTDPVFKGQKVKIAVGLRGSLMYGGSAIGNKGEPPSYENSFQVKTDPFYEFFVNEKKGKAEDKKGE